MKRSKAVRCVAAHLADKKEHSDMKPGLETRLSKHLAHLCEEIGPRPLGSPKNQAAATYIADGFAACGLQVERQTFPCFLWEEISTQLEVDGQSVAAWANTFSAPCDVTAPVVTMGTVAELEAAELTKRIGVLYGDLTKDHGFGARSAVYFPEHLQRIVRLLEEKAPSALVLVNPLVGCQERLMRDWEFPIPSATAPARAGLALLRHGGRTARLRIDAHQSPSQFCNVIARKPGDRPERITFLAHFDTMAGTPGASDNGSGVAVLLALAETLAERELPSGLEWIAVNGEEVGGVGGAAYLRQYERDLEGILALINVDGAGQRPGTNSVTVMGAPEALEAQVRRVHRRHPGIAWVEPWYESDHSAFLWRGVPCIPISSVGGANVAHLPSDTIEWTSPAKLAEVVSLITDIVESLQNGDGP
jgi:aminopeptidase YwaD